jgi:hypothetical protein
MGENKQEVIPQNRLLSLGQTAYIRGAGHQRNVSLLLWWIVVNTAAGIAGGYMAQAVTGHMFREAFDLNVLDTIDVYRIQTLTGLILGFAIGLAQWLILRSYIVVSFWWAPATALGWAVAYISGTYIADDLYEALEAMTYSYIGSTYMELGDVLLGLMFGTFVGFSQCAAFKRRVPRVEFWLITNAVAWVLVLAILTPFMRDAPWGLFDATHQVYQAERLLRRAASMFWVFSTLGLTTGLTLLWLLRQRSRES